MQQVKGRIRALYDHVIVCDMHFGDRKTAGGIVLLGDDAKRSGIRPRWGKVYAIGRDRDDIAVGQWILVEHGRWTHGFKLTPPDGPEVVIRRVDNDAILAISDECPSFDDTINGDSN